MYIEVIALGHFSDTKQLEPVLEPESCTHNSMLQLFFFDERKKYTTKTAAHSKHRIEILRHQKILYSKLSTIWENTDGCDENYQCDIALYLFSMLSQTCSATVFDNLLV